MQTCLSGMDRKPRNVHAGARSGARNMGHSPSVVLDTAGKDAAQISRKRERMASPSVSSRTPIAPR